MKDKFLLPAALAGLLQAVLLFLAMDLFYLYTQSDSGNVLISFFYQESIAFFPCILAVFFGGCYAAPMLFFTKKRTWLWYFLCSVGFFLLFAVFFLVVVYVLPEQVPHIDMDLGELVPGDWEGLLWGLMLMVFSLPYFLFAALAKLAAHLVFIGIWLVQVIRKRRATSL